MRVAVRRGRCARLALPARTRAPLCATSAPPSPPPREKKLLLLGGNGFVGRRVAELALADGWRVVSVSRRGVPENALAGVDWRTGDVTQPGVTRALLAEGGFSALVHAVGLLFEGGSNRLVSGSGSVPSPGATYDAVTRRSAVLAVEAAAELLQPPPSASGPPPFVFVSAAEAGWTLPAPGWLERYLVAKRAAETSLLGERRLRGAVLRPSLVWSFDRPLALPSVAAFYVANAVGLPFVDRPVSVDTLAAAAVRALSDEAVAGVQRYPQMEALAALHGGAGGR